MDEQLINALQNPILYDHPVATIKLVETHISWVILTGSYAYKIKKPVNLGFLDFSTLAKRKHYCEAELRLNRRLAPEFYLDVVAITGTPAAPRWGGTGPVIEYAVKMRQFPAEMELDHLVQQGQLSAAHITRLAVDVAAFHATIPHAGQSTAYGNPDSVWQPIAENFQQLHACCQSSKLSVQLERLHGWCVASHAELLPQLQARKRGGFIRECHGDMHLANMFMSQQRIIVFDCLEFNDALRWIDVISEIAFLTMDLRDRNQTELARLFLDRYLQQTGDYAGVALLNYYQVYRAMVRAKVACIRQQQFQHSATGLRQCDQVQEYMNLAGCFIHTTQPVLFITYGLSGSGKTFLTDGLLTQFDAVRVRSDVERKRLFGLTANANTNLSLATGIYAPHMSERTYSQLAIQATKIIQAGYHTIVDATFLHQAQRAEFVRLAQTLEVPLLILAFYAAPSTLRQRIASRRSSGGDASEADENVLQHQLEQQEPLTSEERTYAIEIDTDMPGANEQLVAAVRRALHG